MSIPKRSSNANDRLQALAAMSKQLQQQGQDAVLRKRMAETGEAASSYQVFKVPPEELYSEKQVRSRNWGDLEGLGDTMLAHGQLSPINVYPKDETGKYKIKQGERRWRAAMLKNIPLVDIRITEPSPVFWMDIAAQLVENIQRENIDPMEIAEGIARMIEQGIKAVEIGRRIGLSPPSVSKYRSLLNLPDFAIELIDLEITRDVDTLNALRKLHDMDPAAALALHEQAMQSGVLPRRTVLTELDNAHARAEHGKAAEENVSHAKLEGTPQQSGEFASASEAPSLPSGGYDVDDLEIDREAKIVPDAALGLPAKPERTKSKVKEEATWKDCDATKVQVLVSAEIDGATVQGFLALDKVDSQDPGYVWIYTRRGKKLTRVAASSVTLSSLKA